MSDLCEKGRWQGALVTHYSIDFTKGQGGGTRFSISRGNRGEIRLKKEKFGNFWRSFYDNQMWVVDARGAQDGVAPGGGGRYNGIVGNPPRYK